MSPTKKSNKAPGHSSSISRSSPLSLSPSDGITIRDPVHGTLEFTDLERRLIDTPDFQRLRTIKQLAMSHLVYPGAHHTRFEHSLGTLHLADQMARHLHLDDDTRTRLRLSALLHDIGHIAFSHEAEEVTAPRLGNHEAQSAKRICSSPLSDILSENDNPHTIASWAGGASYGQLISSDVGADRIDYLLRDAHYTGVAYGVIDHSRILGTLTWVEEKNKEKENTPITKKDSPTPNAQIHPSASHSNESAGPLLQLGGLEAAESLILARFAMFHTVYFHHTVRIARAMLQQALRAALVDSSFDWKAAVQDGDTAMLARLRAIDDAASSSTSVPSARYWAQALVERRLYKRALVLPWSDIDSSTQQAIRSGKLAQELSASTGCSVILDAPGRFLSGTTLRILTPDGPKQLGSLSPLVASLQSAADARAQLLVCAPVDAQEKVAAAARKIFG